MARLTFFIALVFVLSALPTSFASPALARKHYNLAHWAKVCKLWGCGGTPTSSVLVSSTSTTPCASVNPSTTTTEPIPSTTTTEPIPSTTIPEPVPSTTTAGPVPSTTTTEPIPPTTTTEPIPSNTTTEPIPSTSTSSSSYPSTTTTADGASNADIQTYLQAHNSARSQHGAAPLTWSDDLGAKAQQWASGCQFKHSGGSLGDFGENLAAGTGDFTFQNGMDLWMGEASDYNPSNPVYSHFTQVVWKSTTQVGCAVAACSGIFDASYGLAQYYVCEYSPPGNVIGEFAENVQA